MSRTTYTNCSRSNERYSSPMSTSLATSLVDSSTSSTQANGLDSHSWSANRLLIGEEQCCSTSSIKCSALESDQCKLSGNFGEPDRGGLVDPTNVAGRINKCANNCDNCEFSGVCADIEGDVKRDLNNGSKSDLKHTLQGDLKENCELCSGLSVLSIDQGSSHCKETNNNCGQAVSQMNQLADRSSRPHQTSGDQANQSNEPQANHRRSTTPKDERPSNDPRLEGVHKESIIDRTIVDAKLKNDDFLTRQQKSRSRLSVIRSLFRFKRNNPNKQSALDKYQFRNQTSLDANLIESQLNNSISAPVLSTTSNNLPASKPHLTTMSTCSTNNSINQPLPSATSAPFATNGNSATNNVITFKPTSPDDKTSGPIEEEREQWSKKTEFLLAVIGFAVDLGNVWRFPYICYRNGGGAFLFPYLIMMVFGGLPLFYLELALGQYYKNGCLTLWKSICPMMKGIGYAICFIDLYMGMYYNTIISWALYYFCSSFTTTLPWTHCSNEWNTENCRTVVERSLLEQETAVNYTSPAQEFFERSVLEIYRSSGIDDIGQIKPSLAACLACIFLLVYFSLWKGVKSTGKAVWFTAIMPYILLFILLVRGLTLDGSMDGIRYYLYPQWNKLLEINVWIDAATQTFFSLGPGFGTLLALSSYNKFNNNCYKDAILTSTINALTSILSGFVIFSVLGFMAKMANKDISNVAADGPGLVFIVYPEAISTMRFSWFWSLLFFMMLITLGLDSTFGGLEAMITGLCDEYPALLRRNREIFVFVLIVFIYVCALPTVTFGGNYIVNLLDTYGTAMSLLFVVLLESIAISWMYGSKKIATQIEEMHGHRPGRFWCWCWRYISPIFLFVIFVSAVARTKGLELQNYKYPNWSITLGWCITGSSMMCVPAYAIYLFLRTEGTFCQRMVAIVKPAPTKAKQNQTDKPSQPSEV